MARIPVSFQPNKIKKPTYTAWIDNKKFCTTAEPDGTTTPPFSGLNLIDAFDVDWSAYKIGTQNATAANIIETLNKTQPKEKRNGILFLTGDENIWSYPDFRYSEFGFETPEVRLPYDKTGPLIDMFKVDGVSGNQDSRPIISYNNNVLQFHGTANSVPYTGISGCEDAGKILVSNGSSWSLENLSDHVTLDPDAYLPLSGGEMRGDIIPDNDAPRIGMGVTAASTGFEGGSFTPGDIGPGTPVIPAVPRSLGNTNKHFDYVYARQFKGLADNALKLYEYKKLGFGDNVTLSTTPTPVEEGSAETPVYFNDGVPVACTGTLPTVNQIANWNTAFGWGDHSEAGYVTSSGVTNIYVGEGLYLSNLDDHFPSSLTSITTEGRITLKLGYPDQSDYSSSIDDLVEDRQYGVGLDAGRKLSVNVPWTDTYHKHTAGTGISISNTSAGGDNNHDVTVSLLQATTSAIGGIRIGYSGANKNYPVQLNNDGQAYVNVPWTDTQLSLDGYLTSTEAAETYVKKSGDTMTGALNATAFYETSDIRKKEIKSDLSLDKCYDLIDKCQTVIYSLKDQTKELVGMIAQEIEEFFPEVVATDEEGFKSLAYDRLVVICFKVLKDVIKRLEKLEHE